MANTIAATLLEIRNLTDYVHLVRLKPLQPVSFKAGQYLQIVLSANDKRVFSIASSPTSDVIELHIGAGPEDDYPQGALAHLRNSDVIELEIGLGNAYLRDECLRPIILMAGGTGFSYVKSIADYLAETQPKQTVLLYWGAKTADALYAQAEMERWAANHSHFEFIPVIEQPDANWQGKTGFVHHAVMDDIVSLEPYQIYLAGPFKMAGIAREDFTNKGAEQDYMFADAFAFI